MFPGFVNAYKDKDKNVHLYFYPGIDEHNNHIYNSINMSDCMFTYNMTTNEDDSVDICFHNKNIIKINVKMIRSVDSEEEHVSLIV